MTQAETIRKPNIILIMADDMGYSDLGCFGAEINTPNLDSLASGGLRFSQFYNYARCCPTRACILTGLHPHQVGVGHMTTDLGIDAYRGSLNENCITVAEALSESGYSTFMSGKWHVGGDHLVKDRHTWNPGSKGQPTPLSRGFDEHWGTLAGGGSYFDPITLVHNDQFIDPETDNFYYTDQITDNAIRMIDGHGGDNDPFFLYVTYTAPHWPLHALPEDIERYRGTYDCGWDEIRTSRHEELNGSGVLDSKWAITSRNAESPPWNDVKLRDWESARMAVYAAQIDRMDQGIGRLRKKLDSMGVSEDTLIMFLSDNGGCAEFLMEDGKIDVCPTHTRKGEPIIYGNHRDSIPGPNDYYMSYDLPWANASNTPFRMFKHWVHEGGISTPFIANWPRAMAGGETIVHSPAHIIDIMPTLLSAAQTKRPDEFKGQPIPKLEGESFLPALQGARWARQSPITIEHEGNGAVRDNQWKLVKRYPGEWELYNMIEDRTELNDLSRNNPEKVRELTTIYENFTHRVGVRPWDEMLERIVSSGWAETDSAVSELRPGGYI